MAVRIYEWLTGSLGRVLATPSRRPAAHLADRPHVAIARARDGERVRVLGRVVPGTPMLRSPLTDRPCVFWELSIDRRAESEKGPAGWTTIQRVQRVAPFAVEDDTGIATVRTEHFAGWSLRDFRSDVGAAIAVPRARLLEMLEEYGGPQDPIEEDLRAREGIFAPGERIAVDARARWLEIDEGPTAAGYRAPARTRRLELVADPDDPVCASDDPEGPY